MRGPWLGVGGVAVGVLVVAVLLHGRGQELARAVSATGAEVQRRQAAVTQARQRAASHSKATAVLARARAQGFFAPRDRLALLAVLEDRALAYGLNTVSYEVTPAARVAPGVFAATVTVTATGVVEGSLRALAADVGAALPGVVLLRHLHLDHAPMADGLALLRSGTRPDLVNGTMTWLWITANDASATEGEIQPTLSPPRLPDPLQPRRDRAVLAALAAGRRAPVTRAPETAPDSQTAPETETGEAPSPVSPTPLRLDGLLYGGPRRWVVWLNGTRVDRPEGYPGVRITAVTAEGIRVVRHGRSQWLRPSQLTP